MKSMTNGNVFMGVLLRLCIFPKQNPGIHGMKHLCCATMMLCTFICMHALIHTYFRIIHTQSHYIDRQTPKENGRRKVRTGLRWKRRTLLEMCETCDVTPLTLKGIRGETRDEYYLIHLYVFFIM